MPAPTRNTTITVGVVREFSDLADEVNLLAFPPSGPPFRMMGGDDVVILSNQVVGGWSNQVNGNLGRDRFTAQVGSLTRDLVRGGADHDTLDLSNSRGGGDWLNGNLGDDTITGGFGALSVLRGGAGQDVINVLAGSTHIVCGDTGQDTITLQGSGRLILRSDDVGSGGALERNAPLVAAEADRITGFGHKDRAYLPGVSRASDLMVEAAGADSLLRCSSFTNGTGGSRYLARFVGVSASELRQHISLGMLVTGESANRALAALTPDTFLADPGLGSSGVNFS